MTFVYKFVHTISALLRREDPVHLGLGQAKALYALAQDVLRQRPRHRRLPVETNQSDLEAFQEETESQERRS